MQNGGLLTGLIARNIPYLRDRILADKLFLFKVGSEVVIDSGEDGHDHWASSHLKVQVWHAPVPAITGHCLDRCCVMAKC